MHSGEACLPWYVLVYDVTARVNQLHNSTWGGVVFTGMFSVPENRIIQQTRYCMYLIISVKYQYSVFTIYYGDMVNTCFCRACPESGKILSSYNHLIIYIRKLIYKI